MRGMAPLLVREGVRRDAFLASLGSRTWRPRAYSAAVLADPEAVSGRAAYARWLRRTATAWSLLPLPPEHGWPLAVGPEILGGHEELLADLTDLALPDMPASGGNEGVDE